MAKQRLIFVGVLAAILLLSVVRMLLPYRMPEVNSLVPEFDVRQSSDDSESYLENIFAHNLWDKDRTPLLVEDEGQANQQANSLDQDDEDSQKENKSWKLVGVSSEGQEPFAMIESVEGMRRYIEGDVLPDGALLDEVLVYGIKISKSGKNERFYLFGKK